MERYVTVTGWSKHHKQMAKLPGIDSVAIGEKDFISGYVVYWWDGDKKINLTVNTDDPITLKRCAEILALAEVKTGNTYSKITIEDAKYNEDHSPISRKKYNYSKKYNRLTIWEGQYDLMPVYENWNGTITRDRDALADCLM